MKKELKDTAFVGGLLIDGTGAEPVSYTHLFHLFLQNIIYNRLPIITI